MVPVKIQCDCGQSYAFDVEPVDGKMPSTVACPSCGADGTIAANEFISRQLAPPPVTTATPQPIHRTTMQQPAATESSRRGPVDLAKAEQQARAKIMWGESMEEVVAYLTVQGLGRSQAMELAYKVSQERVAIVRSNGIKKTIVGLVLTSVPVIAYLIFHAAGFFLIRRSIWCYIVGIIGVYMLITGIMAIIAPSSEKGAISKE